MQEPMKKSALGVFVIHNLPGPGNQDRAIRAVQDPTGQIPHDVMPKSAFRLRGAGNDQVIFSLPHFSEDLVERQSVANSDFDRQARFFEALLLTAQVTTKLGIRSEQTFHILL